MRIILRRDVDGLGAIGETHEVASGYARNFLLPRKLAVLATPGNERKIEVEKKAVVRHKVKEKEQLVEKAKQFENISCTISVPAGENDKLYGAVTNKDVAEVLAKQGFEVDRKTIEMEPIHELGIFKAVVNLGSEVKATVKVWVVKE